MSIVISQGLPVPAGLATGQIADATQVTPLYSSLNAFNLPDRYVPFQVCLQNDTVTTIDTAGTAFTDYTLTVAVTPAQAFFFNFAFTVPSGAGGLSIVFRKNAVDLTVPLVLNPSGSPYDGSAWIWVPPTGLTNAGLLGILSHGSGGPKLIDLAGGYSNLATTSIGVKITGSGTMDTKTMRVWSQP